jgi:DNA (cytosine-5)-methyltransferase 1
MKFIDMFCGMGTIRMGFERAGHKCVYSIEFDKWKRKEYEVIFGNEPEAGDITKVQANDIPWSDCWCFGAPCQDFSVAGKRAGLDGNRSGLVREVFRLLKEKDPANRPEWLLYENVKGMLSSNKGWDFAAIQAEMGQCGYDVQWQLLNSKDFGVPQNRERVYTLGHLRRYGKRKIFPIGIPDKRTGISVYGYTKESSVKDRTRILNTYGVSQCLRSTDYKDPPKIAELKVRQIGNVMPTTIRSNPNQGRVYDKSGLSPCLNKMEGGGRQPLIEEPCACLTPDRVNKRQNGRRFKNPGEPMFTLTKQDIHGIAIVGNVYQSRGQAGKLYTTDGISPTVSGQRINSQGYMQNGTRIRRLTPRECMRLQGVPDYITDKLIAAGISDTQLYRAAGDACTVNVIYEIARRLS